MHSQQSSPDWAMLQVILEQLSPLTQAALRFCSLSLVKLPYGFAVMITSPREEVTRLLEGAQLVEIARVIQKTYGNSLLCLFDVPKDLISRWNTQQLSQVFPI